MRVIEVAVEAGGAGAPTRVTVTGDIDLASAADLRERLGPALEDAAGHAEGLLLDLCGVGYLDSSGLRLLAAMARDLGDTLVVVAPAGTAARRVLEVSHLTDHLTVAESPPA